MTYVVAAGNDNSDLKGFVPAAYDEVLTVTAMADFNGKPGGGAALQLWLYGRPEFAKRRSLLRIPGLYRGLLVDKASDLLRA